MSDNQDLENTIIIELKDGPVHITLLPDVAPLHCARMKELARSGQYDNVCFQCHNLEFSAISTQDCGPALNANGKTIGTKGVHCSHPA